MATPATPGPDPTQEQLRGAPAGELFKRLSEDTSKLVKLEIELAKTEMTDKAKTIGAGAGLLGAAALFGLFAFAAFTTLLIALLSEGMDTWVAALIVTVIYVAIAAIAAVIGKNRIQKAGPPVPEQTIETVKEDVEWAKTRSTSATR